MNPSSIRLRIQANIVGREETFLAIILTSPPVLVRELKIGDLRIFGKTNLWKGVSATLYNILRGGFFMSLTIILRSFVVVKRSSRGSSSSRSRCCWRGRGRRRLRPCHRGRCRRRCRYGSGSRGIFCKLDIVAGEETPLTLRVGAQPPVLINHVNVGDILTFKKLNLIVLGLLIVILHNGLVTSLTALSGRNLLRFELLPGNSLGCTSSNIRLLSLVRKIIILGYVNLARRNWWR
jgi:hypothetical protein